MAKKKKIAKLLVVVPPSWSARSDLPVEYKQIDNHSEKLINRWEWWLERKKRCDLIPIKNLFFWWWWPHHREVILLSNWLLEKKLGKCQIRVLPPKYDQKWKVTFIFWHEYVVSFYFCPRFISIFNLAILGSISLTYFDSSDVRTYSRKVTFDIKIDV